MRALDAKVSLDGNALYRHPENQGLSDVENEDPIERRAREEGVQYVAEKAGAYWLVDELALAQSYVAAVKAEAFQVWTLTVKADGHLPASVDVIPSANASASTALVKAPLLLPKSTSTHSKDLENPF